MAQLQYNMWRSYSTGYGAVVVQYMPQLQYSIWPRPPIVDMAQLQYSICPCCSTGYGAVVVQHMAQLQCSIWRSCSTVYYAVAVRHMVLPYPEWLHRQDDCLVYGRLRGRFPSEAAVICICM